MADAPSTRELVVAARQGDAASARALFDAYHRRVMAYFLAVSRRDRDTALDLTQETFMRIFRALGDLDDPDRFEPWLWTTARRVAATHGSKNRRYADVLGLFELERGVHVEGDDHDARRARVELVRELLDELPEDRTREVVRLKYTDPEHTTRQIAQLLEMPHGTVTVTLRRFRERIRRKLARALRALDGEDVA